MIVSGVGAAPPAAAGDVLAESMVSLHSAIITYSVSPDPTIDFVPCDGELILYVPPALNAGGLINPECNLRRAFESAQNFSAQSNRIRIVADGATIRSVWPCWVHSAMNIVLTEAGAYRSEDSVTATRPIAKAVRDWLDDLFEGVVGKVRPSNLFFSSACSRFLQPTLAETTILPSLLRAHCKSNVVVVGQKGKRSRGGAKALLWKCRLAATLTLYLGKALAGQIRNFIRNCPARRKLAVRRASFCRHPDVWLALIPNWRRINRHVIDFIIPAAKLGGRRVGILWVVNMGPGEIGDRGHDKIKGTHLWPVLEDIKISEYDLEIEQLVGPETFPKLITSLCAGFGASFRVGYRLIRNGPMVRDYGTHFTLWDNFSGLAALATTDVLQAIGIERAFNEVKRRRNLSGIPVVFASLSQVDTATAEALLRHEGATTIDFKHGSGGDGWFGQTETFASYAATWTATDAINCDRQGVASIVVHGGPPKILKRQPNTIRNVLILSNYVHRDWRLANFPFAPFQSELLSVVRLAEEQFPGRFDFRWRPHPDDVDDLVNKEIANNPAVKLCRDGSLSEALAWAELAIISPSSSAVEALEAGVPILIHAPPAANIFPEIQAIAEERRFFYAAEGADKLGRIARKFENRDVLATQADRDIAARWWPPQNDLLANTSNVQLEQWFGPLRAVCGSEQESG